MKQNYKTRYLVACRLCNPANLLYDNGFPQLAEDSIRGHARCSVCSVLVGVDHYSTSVDAKGRCNTCAKAVTE